MLGPPSPLRRSSLTVAPLVVGATVRTSLDFHEVSRCLDVVMISEKKGATDMTFCSLVAQESESLDDPLLFIGRTYSNIELRISAGMR